jgi:hypothetical protein
METLGAQGSYTIYWNNSTGSTVTVNYELRFYDSADFELDRWAFPGLLTVTLAPGETARLVTGTFELRSTRTIELANEIVRMQIWAAFS